MGSRAGSGCSAIHSVQTLAVEQRGAEMHLERLPELVAELVASKVDVIVANGYPAAVAAKEGTSTIPIVISASGDPVSTHLVASLARPGGNVTGISDVAAQLAPKRLELLKEMVPSLRRVAMLYNASDRGMTMRWASLAEAAKGLASSSSWSAHAPDDFTMVFAAMNHEMPDGLLMVSDSLTRLNRKRVYDFAAAHRLPAIYEADSYARDGGLMSYGPDGSEAIERVASLIDRVLKGAKPADLPLEQPTRFRLVINLKTAKALGLTVPPTLLDPRRRGDRIKMLFAAVRWSLLALNGQTDRAGFVGYWTNNGQRAAQASIDTQRLTHKRHWLCTAAMVLMPVSAPIKVLSLSRYNAVS